MGTTVATAPLNMAPIIFVERRGSSDMKKKSAEADKASYFCKNAKKLAKRCERIRRDQSVSQYFHDRRVDPDEPDMMARNYNYDPQKVGRSIMIGWAECQTLAQKLNDYCEKHGLEGGDPKEIVRTISDDPVASMAAIAKIEEEMEIVSIPTFLHIINTKKTP